MNQAGRCVIFTTVFGIPWSPDNPSGSAPSWLRGSQGCAASNKGLNMLAVQGAFLAHVKRYGDCAPKLGFWHFAQHLSGPPGAQTPRTDRFEEHRLSTRPI